MLLELLSHFARLAPVADRYFAGRAVNDKAQQETLAGLAAEVRGGLGKLEEAREGLGRQLQEQGAQAAELSVEVTRARMGVESVEARLAGTEKKLDRVRWMLGAVFGLLVMAVALLAVLVARGLH